MITIRYSISTAKYHVEYDDVGSPSLARFYNPAGQLVHTQIYDSADFWNCLKMMVNSSKNDVSPYTIRQEILHGPETDPALTA